MITRKSTRLLTAGVIGSAVTAVCCFTPALVVLLSVVGLGSLTGYLDYVLLPALAIFLTTTGYALIRRRERRCNPLATCQHCGITTDRPFIKEGEAFCCERCYLRALTVKEAYRRLDAAYCGTMEALVSALDLRECETHRHSERVADYTRALAKKMGIKGKDLEDIYRGALLHDIGKIGVPDAILLKPSSLTAEEWKVMKKHPEMGQRILMDVEFLKAAADIVIAHEERLDGSGYPKGLRGDQIPLGARIFAVMDALDAMAFDRPYRKAVPFEAVVREILKGAGTQFDPVAVEVFRANARTFEEWVQRDQQEECEPHGEHRDKSSV